MGFRSANACPTCYGKQILFDLIFGVVMPLICLSYDLCFRFGSLLGELTNLFLLFHLYGDHLSAHLSHKSTLSLYLCGIFLAVPHLPLHWD